MGQTFIESCVDFEVAHLSVLRIWRLQYPEIPTFSDAALLCSGGGRLTEPLEGTDSCCTETRRYVIPAMVCIPYDGLISVVMGSHCIVDDQYLWVPTC